MGKDKYHDLVRSALEKEGEKIAVEIKSFSSPSDLDAFETTVQI